MSKETTTMQRVIDANLVNALKPFVSKDETRLALSGIHFTHNDQGKPIAVATDGRKIAVIEQYQANPDDYPKFPNGGYPEDSRDPISVPVKPLLDALKKLPKKTTLPILTTPPLISIRNEKGEPTQACIPVTDLDTHSIETTRAIDACFPNYQQVIPPEDATVLDATVLADIAQSVIDFTKNGVKEVPVMKLCIGDNPGAPLRIEVKDPHGRKMTIVAMPYKEGVLVNKVGAGMAEELKAVTERLATVAEKLEALGQLKAKRAKKVAEGTETAQAA